MNTREKMTAALTIAALVACLAVQSANAEGPSRTLADGLIAYMTFDSTVTENSISGSSVSPTSSGSVGVAANGKFGSYVDFPPDTGTGNYVYLAGSESGYEGEGKCFTATLWVKLPASVSGDPVILANKSWFNGSLKGFVLFNPYLPQVKFNVGDGDGGRIDIGPVDNESTDEWTFYAITGDSDGVLTLYQGRKDGTLGWVCDSLSGSSMENGAGFCIGNNPPEAGAYSWPFVGGVDDLGTWTRTLTQDEIRLVYEAGRVGIPLGTLTAPGPATATWTGAISSDATVAGNWSGNEVPTLDTEVTVSGTASLTLAEGTMLLCKSILFDNVTLGADANLRGLDAAKIASGSSIDLNGHALYLRTRCSPQLSVTDSSADAAHPGELHIDDVGVDIANTTMALSGNLRFFKSGAGKFTSSASATYTGGFAVEGGTFFMTRQGSGAVYVGAGATLDAYGFDLMYCSHVTLAGGTITSTSNGRGVTLCASMDVTADSSIVMANLSDYHDMGVLQYEWNLGGNTLTLVMDGYDPDFTLVNGGTMSNGTFKVVVMPTALDGIGASGIAWVHFADMNGRDGLNLDLGTSVLRMKNKSGNSKVCDFTCNPPTYHPVHSELKMEVYGTFTPQGPDGFNLLMMDGSAIDFSAQSAPWNCHFTNAGGSAGGDDDTRKVAFDTGATVTIKFGERDLHALAASGEYVALWATDAVPDSSVKFVIEERNAEKYKVKRDNTGLKVREIAGLTLILR